MAINVGYEPVAAAAGLAQMAGQAKAQQIADDRNAGLALSSGNQARQLQEVRLRGELAGLSDDRKFAYDQTLQDMKMEAALQLQVGKWSRDQQKLQQALDAIDDSVELADDEKETARQQALVKWGAGMAPTRTPAPKPVGSPIMDKQGNYYQQIYDPTTGQVTVQPVRPEGQSTPIQGTPGGAGNSARTFQMGTKLRQEFLADPVYKSLGKLQVQNSIIQEAHQLMTDPKNRSRTFLDQAMIMTFNKILDPDSAVREGEYDRTEANTAVLKRWAALSNKWFNKGGVSIPVGVFKDAVALSEAMTRIREDWVAKKYSAYRNIATLNGLDPDMVFGDLISSQLGQPSSLAAKPTESMNTEELLALARQGG